ncbi:DUF3857 domain-containing protein [Altibacter sp.]|uniref:DUF3857 domain-containing protein n=1 Tax=Altibacter sp. TaxID=2024823 RepID=UPI0025BFF38A|nr:DUF3857 domain-containing protein [Altibacter sp.]
MSLTLAFCTTLAAQTYKFDEIGIRDFSKLRDDVFPEAPAVLLVQDIRFKYGYELYVNERIKIYTKDGFEFSNWDSQFDDISGLRAYIYNLEDGVVTKTKIDRDNIFKEKIEDGYEVTKIAFPNVKEGSILELSYKVHYVGMRWLNAQSFIPIKKLKIAIQNPGYYSLKIVENPLATIDLIRQNDRSEIRFLGENIPALKRESHIYNLNNYRGKIFLEQVRTKGKEMLSDWSEVSKIFNDYGWYAEELEKNGHFFEGDITALLGTEKDPLIKAKRIYSFLQNRMTWNERYSRGSDNLRKSYMEQRGNAADINLLLIFMLRKSGIEANPVLVASKYWGRPVLPTIYGLNNLIAAAEIDGETYLLDATDKIAPFGLLRKTFMNGNGIIIYEDDTYKLVSTNKTDISKMTTLVTASLEPESQSVTGSVRTRYQHHYAWEFRDTYSAARGRSFEEEMENTVELLEVNNVKTNNFNEIEKPLDVSYDFEYSDFIETINDKLYVSPLLFLGIIENPYKDTDRLYPVEEDFPFVSSCIFKIKLPEGYIPESLPEPISILVGDDVASLKYNISAQGNTIQVSYQIEILKATIPPEYYEGLKRLYGTFLEISNAKIVLGKIDEQK